MDETNVGNVSSKLNIKSRRKSMVNKKMLMQLEENKINSKKDITDYSSKRASLISNSLGELKLRLNENDNDINNKITKQRKRRKSEFIRPVFELNNYLTLKATLIDIPELIVQQESDI